jgi:hypothetical protein
MGNKALDAVLAAPSLTRLPGIPRHSPGAQEAFASVEELAMRQSEAKQEAAQFSPVVGSGTGVSCSFNFNPDAGIVDFESEDSLDAKIKKHGGGFKISIKFF